MSREFLSYWRPSTAEWNLENTADQLIHLASDQYGRVSIGDTIWIVTAWPGGRLALLGHFLVGKQVSEREAKRILKTGDPWESKYHLIAAQGTETAVINEDISDLAPQLRFRSTRDRLTVVNGSVNPQQLQ